MIRDKICVRCGKEMLRRKNRKSHKSYWYCPPCQVVKGKAYRESHRDLIHLRQALYRRTPRARTLHQRRQLRYLQKKFWHLLPKPLKNKPLEPSESQRDLQTLKRLRQERRERWAAARMEKP